jgi:uncharacterized protein
MSMSSAAIPTFEITLNALSRILDKAEAHATAKKFDVAVLLNSRLAPDMFNFTRQVQVACDAAKNAAARLSGIEPPKFEDTETTLPQLQERIARTIAFVKSVDTKAIDASGGRTITLPLGPQRKGEMKGADYLNHFALPNFYFHVAAAYMILRHNGVELGKLDFLHGIPLKVL